MIDIDEFRLDMAQSTKPGDWIEVDGRETWNLRFQWPIGEAEDKAEPEQWLLNLGGQYAFTCERIVNLKGDPALVLGAVRMQIEQESIKAINSLHGMVGWAVLSEHGAGLVAEGPSRIPPRNLIVGLNGEVSGLTGGKYAFAFEKWQLVTGTDDSKRVIFERSTRDEA